MLPKTRLTSNLQPLPVNRLEIDGMDKPPHDDSDDARTGAFPNQPGRNRETAGLSSFFY